MNFKGEMYYATVNVQCPAYQEDEDEKHDQSALIRKLFYDFWPHEFKCPRRVSSQEAARWAQYDDVLTQVFDDVKPMFYHA